MSDAAVLWFGIYLTLQKGQRKGLNFAVGTYLIQKPHKEVLFSFVAFILNWMY